MTIPEFYPPCFELVDFSDISETAKNEAYCVTWQNEVGHFSAMVIFKPDGEKCCSGIYSRNDRKFSEPCLALPDKTCIALVEAALVEVSFAPVPRPFLKRRT